MINSLLPILKTKGVEFKYTKTYDPLELNGCPIGSLRPYQQDISNHIQKNPRTLIHSPCGSGKTIVSGETMSLFKYKTLILAPYLSILHQTAKKMEEWFGLAFNKVNSGCLESKDGWVTLATPQSAISQIFKVPKKFGLRDLYKYDPKDFPQFDVLISDEGQFLGADSFFTSAMLSNATLRLSLSATPYRTDSREIFLDAAVSTNRLVIPRKPLIDSGYLTNTEYVYKIYECKDTFNGIPYDYSSAYERLMTDESYLNYICDLYYDLDFSEKPCIVLTFSVEQAKRLSQKLNCPAITGASSESHRTGVLEGLKNGDTPCIVGTSVLNVGVDVPNLRSLILTGGGESKSLFLQQIGRLDRIFPGKTRALCIDIYPRFSWFWDHSQSRYDAAVESEYVVDQPVPVAYTEKTWNTEDFLFL